MSKNLNQWLAEYSDSHKNPQNKFLHRICVPAIFFSLLGMLWCVPVGAINLAWIVIAAALILYIRLGLRAVLLILPQCILTVTILMLWDDPATIFPVCLGIFVIAWIGQFIGHKIEGKKPSFFQDLQFLLIGPLWIFLSPKAESKK